MISLSPSCERHDTSFTSKVYVSLIVFVVFTCIAALAQQPKQAEGRGGLDWIFVVDTSASMRGVGGTKNIFNQVRGALAEFITNARAGDSVTIYSFDRDTQTNPTVHISDETDKRDLINMVNNLEANGERTHTGKAIHDALVRAGELAERTDAAKRRVGIVLLTDGLEDVRGIPNPVSIPSTVSLIPKNRPYIFFVSLGENKETGVEQALKGNPNLGGFETIDRPAPDTLSDLDERIRPVLEKPKPTPVQIEIVVSPAVIYFGEIEPGEQTSPQMLKVKSSEDTSVQLVLGEAVGFRLVEPSGPLAVKAGKEVQVPVQVAVLPEVDDSARTLQLSLTPENVPPGAIVVPGSAQLQITVKHTPVWRRALKWLALAIVLLILLIAGYAVAKGEMPWTLLSEWRTRKQLEGELEIIRPAVSEPDDAIVNLSALHSQRAALSALLPSGATADSDAELATVYKSGVKQVRLERTRGAVRINNAEVANADLYDGYVIELGDAKVRFNWLGHDEPVVGEPEV